MTRTLLAIIATCVLVCGCKSQRAYHPGGPYYYKSWVSYELPHSPVGELTLQETRALEEDGRAYYVAFFNDDGRIKSFEKRIDDKTVWKTVYRYKKGKLEQSETVRANGSRSVWRPK